MVVRRSYRKGKHRIAVPRDPITALLVDLTRQFVELSD